MSYGNNLLNNPLASASIFDPMLMQSSTRGVEAALAAFDMQIALGGFYGRDSIVQSSGNNIGSFLVDGDGSAYGQIRKPLRSGGTLSLAHSWNYSTNNISNQIVNPDLAGFVQAEFRQPLLAGRGEEITRISGPQTYRQRVVGSGVSLAEINEAIAAFEYQQNVERLAKEVEELYWELWLAIQGVEFQQKSQDKAKEIYQRVKQRAETGLNGGSAAALAQAEENMYRREIALQDAKTLWQQSQQRLKRHLNISATDGDNIVPIDEPNIASCVCDFDQVAMLAGERRVEVQKHNLMVRAVELQVIPAKSLLLPQLDLVSGVQLNGLGQGILDSSAFSIDGEDVGWNVGLEFSMPLGFNRERQALENLNTRLQKARVALSAQKSEIAHEVRFAYSEIEKWFVRMEFNRKQLAAAGRRNAAVENEYLAGRTTLDQVVDSQVALAESELELATTITQYNKSLTEFEYRKGVILDGYSRNRIEVAQQISFSEAELKSSSASIEADSRSETESKLDSSEETQSEVPKTFKDFSSSK